MTTYYFSGVDRAAFIEVLAREGAAGMVNASNATQPALTAAYQRWPEVPLVLDSGAFQGLDDPGAYAEIVHEVGDRFRWVANLDVIGDQAGSDYNWLRLRDEYDVQALWVYQVEGGADLARLEQMVDRLGFVGIGGLVPVIKRDVSEALQLIEAVGEILQSRGRAHFFGVGSAVILSQFGGEPWFASADSQSWLCGFKAHELIARGGRRLRTDDAGLELTREECAAQNVRQVHSWLAGRPMQMALF
jgi:hypothetical protein